MTSITDMEGSVSNVQFTERKRGFDPDEVANYLHQIDGKIAGMRAMASEAMDRAELAEERARLAEQAAALRSSDDDVAEAASILAMAQRTADATVSEARTEAARLLAAATTEADQVRAVSQAEAQQLIAEARREIDSTRTEHLDILRHEVAVLEESRDAIQMEVDELARIAAVERVRLREAAVALLDLADNPTGLGAGANASDAGNLADAGDGQPFGDDALGDDALGDDADRAAEHEAVWTGEDPGPDGSLRDELIPDVAEIADDPGVDPASGSGDTTIDEPNVIAESPVEYPADAARVTDTDWSDENGQVVVPGADTGFAEQEATTVFSGLFDDDDPVGLSAEIPFSSLPEAAAGGRYTDGSASARAGDESSLGPVDEADDAAMRAFFERDEGDDGSGSRWGRRRR